MWARLTFVSKFYRHVRWVTTGYLGSARSDGRSQDLRIHLFTLKLK